MRYKTIKKEYKIHLRCAICGREDSFEYNDNKTYVKCTFCNREYFRGIEELKGLNKDQLKNYILSTYFQQEV